MSSFLRPRRGKRSTAVSTLTGSNPLKRGEIFFEVPTGGVGTGTGKLKMGDGSTAYANLPYFLSMDDSVVTFTDSSASSSWNNYSNYLANIKTGITLPTFFANTKNLLYQLCNKVTSLNNDLVIRKEISAGATGYNFIWIPFKQGYDLIAAYSKRKMMNDKDIILMYYTLDLENNTYVGYLNNNFEVGNYIDIVTFWRIKN